MIYFKNKADFLGPVIGLTFIWIFGFTSLANTDDLIFRMIRYSFIVLGILLIMTPFSNILEKYKLTRYLYLIVQLVVAVIFSIFYLYVVFAKVFLAIAIFSILQIIIYSEILSNFDTDNQIPIIYYLSFTITAISFSYKGNTLLHWFSKAMHYKSEKRKNDIILIKKFTGQSQLKYLFYFLYFISLVIFTVLDFINTDSPLEDFNLIKATLQSFATFIAFETLIEKSHLLSVYKNEFNRFKERLSRQN